MLARDAEEFMQKNRPVSTFKESTHPASLYYTAKCITGQYSEH